MQRSKNLISWAGPVLLLASLAASGPSMAADASHLTFVTHAAFFSAETKQPKSVDPHAFVADAAAPVAVGPQNISHVAGFRPAFIDQDAMTVAISNAKGEAIGFTLGDWLAASGSVTLTPAAGGKVEIAMSFDHLKPGGHYSLFENHFDQKPVGFTPLDGTATTNDFVASADGKAKLTIMVPQPLTHDNAVLLVYHSDGAAHGAQRGDIGVNAHHQLIARIPE
ncbi:hypothetical protein [Bradyrhizobium sp. SZCCHNR2028]|uniref:hypothetical protein n=1 Tax=Bradyrhizobium sp. SZCCHNR2028 TaxID=3057382 RepID=UPI0028E3CCAC|nr:hypothetical protein [Bradyrhizobium sp. SZCCHNR2028]